MITFLADLPVIFTGSLEVQTSHNRETHHKIILEFRARTDRAYTGSPPVVMCPEHSFRYVIDIDQLGYDQMSPAMINCNQH